MLPSAIPTDIHELQARIRRDFPQSNELATELYGYFVSHQFDEWMDIEDDISNGYHQCCCKHTVFKYLDITNIEQKRCEYERLKRCLDPLITIGSECTPQASHIPVIPPANATFKPVFQAIIRVFCKEFNKECAQHILALFKYIVHNEGYEDIESIKDDVQEPNNSIIIEHILGKHLNYNLFQEFETKERIKRIITKHVIAIVNVSNEGRDPHELIPNMDPTEVTIAYISKQIELCFAAEFKEKSIGKNLSESFLKIVKQEAFDIDSVRDDMRDDIGDSVILTKLIELCKYRWNDDKTKEIKIQIKAIVEGETNIQIMGTQIIEHFEKEFALMIWNEICWIIIENNFTFEDVLQDIKSQHESILRNGLQHVHNITAQHIKDVVDLTTNIIHIKAPIQYFNILLFSFNITKRDVKETADICIKHCPFMYNHFDGVPEQFQESYLKSTKGKALCQKLEGKALCIAKAIDIKNKKPLIYWLLHLFSKQRWAKYRNGELSIKDAYDIHRDWWRENKYARWIQKTHPIIAQEIQSALEELAHRIFPVIKCDNSWAPFICDRVDDFASYALALHAFVYRIKQALVPLKKQIENGYLPVEHELDIAPMQIDCMIIPQMTKKRNSGKTPFRSQLQFAKKVDYLKLSEEPDQTPDRCIWKIEDALTHRKYGYIQDRDFWMIEAPDVKNTDELTSTLFDLLQNAIQIDGKQRCNRYILIIDRRHPENLCKQTLNEPPIMRKEQKKEWKDKIYLIKPKQYRDQQKNPLCICGRKLIQSKRNHRIMHLKCRWCDNGTENKEIWQCPKTSVAEHKEVYILCSDACEKERPNTHSKISSKWDILPESCFSLSKEHMFLNPNTDSKSITIDDALEGYMFGLSYHIFDADNIGCYWYHNTGGTVFELSDIASGWPQWFHPNDNMKCICGAVLKEMKIKDGICAKCKKTIKDVGYRCNRRYCNEHKEGYDVCVSCAQLSEEILKKIEDYSKEFVLPNTDLKEFERQSSMCDIVVLPND